MFCVKCGKRIDDNAKFCNYCGSRTDDVVVEEKETKVENLEEQTFIEAEVVEESVSENEETETFIEEQVVEEDTPKQTDLVDNSEQTTVLVNENSDANIKNSEIIKRKIQGITENQVVEIEKLRKRKHKKEAGEKVSGGFKIFLNVLWVIFGGLYNTVVVAIWGALECITLIGIPFGIVLFKTLPLMFMPIGKRVVTHYGTHPVANTFWLIFGGFFFALGYTLFTLFLFVTIIGIPIAIQMMKISSILWAPFGAEILPEDEFSSSENEITAYTIQYVRKERIVVDLERLNCDYKQADIIRNICDINCPLNKVLKKNGFNVIPIIVAALVFAGIEIFSFVAGALNLNETLDQIYASILSVFPENIASFLSNDFFTKTGMVPVLLIVLFVAIVLVACFSSKHFAGNKVYDYGFATRKELVKAYDSGAKINKNTLDLVYVIYRLYEREINAEIANDKNKAE